MWLSGPSYLYLPRDQMPFSREFLQKDPLPVAELRAPKVALLATNFAPIEASNLLYKLAHYVMDRTNSFKKASHQGNYHERS